MLRMNIRLYNQLFDIILIVLIRFMTYSTFFQIHIPKTGGTYFKKNILEQIIKTLNNNNVTIADEKDLGLHLCWFKPLIQKETYNNLWLFICKC